MSWLVRSKNGSVVSTGSRQTQPSSQQGGWGSAGRQRIWKEGYTGDLIVSIDIDASDQCPALPRIKMLHLLRSCLLAWRILWVTPPWREDRRRAWIRWWRSLDAWESLIRTSQCAQKRSKPSRNVTATSKQNTQNQSPWGNNLATVVVIRFQCFSFRESGDAPIGANAKMTGRQMTDYMLQFPQSERTGQTNPKSYYKNYKNRKVH